MKKTTILAICVALVGATGAVKADFITGALSIDGNAAFDNTTIGSATEVTDWDSPETTRVGSGSFSSIPRNTDINITAPWTFNSGATLGFISFDGYTFNLATSTITSQTGGPNGGVTVYGYGTLFGNGFSPTTYAYTFSSTGLESGSPLEQSFQATLYVLPDGGTTAALLGGSLTILGLIRRKLAA